MHAIIVFFVLKRYSRCFAIFKLSHALFYCYVSGPENISVALVSMRVRKRSDFIINILVCVLKMNGFGTT